MLTERLVSPFLVPAAPPEWRRSGPFIALAIVLHAAILAVPLRKALEELPLPPLNIRLTEAVRPPEPLPQALPKPLPQTPAAPASPRKPNPAPVRHTPVLAMDSAPVTPSPMPAVAPAAPKAAESAPVATVPNAHPAPAAGPVTAARFDAAYLQNPKPAYPALSRRLGEEGKVLLKVRVTADGHPASVDLEKTSGFDRLDEAARQAVSRWRFVPAKRGEEAIEASVIVPLVFRLDN